MTLQIKLVNAILSHDTQFFSNMDPYCIFKLGPQTFRSRTKNEAGKRPVWNETFNFTAYDNILKVTVMDEDTVTDDLVGEGTVDISRFRNNPTEQQQMVQLYYHGKNAGKVQIMVRGTVGNNPNVYGQTNPNVIPQPNPNIIPQSNPNVIPFNAITGIAQGNGGWGGQGNGGWGQTGQTGGNYNPYPPQNNPYMPIQPIVPPQQPAIPPQQPQWGNLNNNNGWGDFNPSTQFNKGSNTNNLYPSLDNTNANTNNNFNPLSLMGQFLGQQTQTNPNQNIQNQSYQNPNMQNQSYQNPNMQNQSYQNPNMQNQNYQNPNMQNQNYQNPNMQNNVPLHYQLINGMGMLNKGSAYYGTNPYK